MISQVHLHIIWHTSQPRLHKNEWLVSHEEVVIVKIGTPCVHVSAKQSRKEVKAT